MAADDAERTFVCIEAHEGVETTVESILSGVSACNGYCSAAFAENTAKITYLISSYGEPVLASLRGVTQVQLSAAAATMVLGSGATF